MKKLILALLILSTAFGCKKLIDVDTPKNQLTSDKVFADSVSATAALGNIYAQLDKTVEVTYSRFLDMYADDMSFTGTTPQTLEFVQSNVSASNSSDLNPWRNLYLVIYQCNDLLAQVGQSNKLSAYNTNLLINEAKFVRAFAYFYLVNTYGRVPKLLTTDINETGKASQSDMADIYSLIIADLSDAKYNLPANYQGGVKTRANKWAATALLARVYLYRSNWTLAEQNATEVINSGLYSPLNPPGGIFQANSKEAILQIWTQNGFAATTPTLVPSTNTALPTYPVSPSLYQSFENNDQRKTNWIGTSTVGTSSTAVTYRYFYKYKNRVAGAGAAEYLMVLRAGEQYLIRAEARAQQDKITGAGSATEDLNIIRNRAGLSNTTAVSRPDMLMAITQERRAELFGEWGSRFLDLKRNNLLNTVISPSKSAWQSFRSVLPIPQNELTYNPSLIQNPGYN